MGRRVRSAVCLLESVLDSDRQIPPIAGLGRLIFVCRGRDDELDYSDLALLLLRGWVGVVMFVHGANHARTLDGTDRWLGRVGWRAPRFQAWLLSVAEIAIGAGMILGLMTTAAAAGTVSIVLVAFLTQHLRNGFFIFNKGQGYEYVITLAIAGASVALIGAGEWSLDAALDVNLSGANRGQILLAVIGLAAVHLAVSWRPGRVRHDGA